MGCRGLDGKAALGGDQIRHPFRWTARITVRALALLLRTVPRYELRVRCAAIEAAWKAYACAVGRMTISFTSTSAGCSIANAMPRAIASGGIAILSRA